METGTPYMLYKDACNQKVIKKHWHHQIVEFML